MTDFYLHLFRENNGEREYVVITEEDYSKEDIEDQTLLGYYHETSMSCQTLGSFHKLPTDTILMKNE